MTSKMRRRNAFLLVENPRKSSNLGPLLRCAAAHGIATILAVGYSQCSVDGSHGASNYVDIVAFPTVEQAIHSLRQQQQPDTVVSVVGILHGMPMEDDSKAAAVHEVVVVQGGEGSELSNNNNKTATPTVVCATGSPQSSLNSNTNATISSRKSFPIGSRPFDASANSHCFVFSKSSRGMPVSLAQVCDFFVHIPHRSCRSRSMGPSPAAPLLDCHACLSIVLHHFSEWAKYEERTFQGHKFQLDRHPPPNAQQRQTLHHQRQIEQKALYQEQEEQEIPTTAMETTAPRNGFFATNNNDDDKQEEGGDY
jgi:tRNA G18 (ribose-2'-O)-methylase SpoU